MSKRAKKRTVKLEEDAGESNGSEEEFHDNEVEGDGSTPGKRKKRHVLEVDSEIPVALLEKERNGTLSSGEEKELKRLRRVLKNRLAAQQFRRRQKEHLEELEVQLVQEEAKNEAAKERLEQLRAKNASLRGEINKVLDQIVLEKAMN
jgi:transcriptional activator HAC1